MTKKTAPTINVTCESEQVISQGDYITCIFNYFSQTKLTVEFVAEGQNETLVFNSNGANFYFLTNYDLNSNSKFKLNFIRIL